jgi:hypothetical protein
VSRDKIAMDLWSIWHLAKGLWLKGAYEGSRMLMIPRRKNALESPTAPRSLSDVVPLVTCS